MIDYCPRCAANLRGDPIPQEYIDAGYYAPVDTHYSLLVGIDGGRMGVYDGVIAWQCPSCGFTWAREHLTKNPRVVEFVKECNTP